MATPLRNKAFALVLFFIFSALTNAIALSSAHALARAPRCTDGDIWCGRACCQQCAFNGVCLQDPPPPLPKPYITTSNRPGSPYNELWVNGYRFSESGTVSIELHYDNGGVYDLPNQKGKSFHLQTASGDCTGRTDMGTGAYLVAHDYVSGMWTQKLRVRVCKVWMKIDDGPVLVPAHNP